MNSINFGGGVLEIRIVGADEVLEKCNQLEAKLKEVKALSQEITSMVVSIEVFNLEKEVGGPIDN